GARGSDIWNREIELQLGEQIFIQAPSGTGKTTLIHCLYGLRKDYEGSVKWDGNLAAQMDAEQWSAMRQKHVSIVFQDMRLFPTLTAWENLEAKRLLTNHVSQEEVRTWMDLLGITDRADKLGSTLSYGEQQRVAIIRALLQPFNWLLMDEPFSHLDAANIKKAASLIAEQVKRNNASFLLADLDDNNHFAYSKKLCL
ncbi:MAG: ATP-binding cassette domain-containing protein, partial [Chitinophagaceae bacterium]